MFNHQEIENKWQKYWSDVKAFELDINSTKPKYYVLDMFPYPSGTGLHVGHVEGYTATDIMARFKRLSGFNVLHPIGFDAFGLPAEQFAIKTGNDPQEFTNFNIANFERQLKDLGFSYDWSRKLKTTDPQFYKWTQWIFKKLYENDLAELKEMPVNYCPVCQTVLANEEVINGQCERFGHDVEIRSMKQWVLKITKYADRLLNDLEFVDWPESVKTMQRNWIGKSSGAEINFEVKGYNQKITVFTTRPETIFGVTYLVIAPDHEFWNHFELDENVKKYITAECHKSERERQKEIKNGIDSKIVAINPLTNEEIPVWIGNYVLKSYGTGMVMACPNGDERDYEFAQQYNLPIKKIYEIKLYADITPPSEGKVTHDKNILINSANDKISLNELNSEEARLKIIKYLKEHNLGNSKTTYKLRDWLFSRQRYWGEPFPVIHTKEGIKLVADDELPVVLPKFTTAEPGADGQSPLANDLNWINTPIGQRETNTMPQWAGSSWYYLRYINPHNKESLISENDAAKWSSVDLYIGGAEHAVLHLLYARFWHKFLYDIGVVPTIEPFQKLFNQGMILGPNGEKMSKSKGNVINPDDIIAQYGADTLRLYEMFMGPLEDDKAWSEETLRASRKFLERVYKLANVSLEAQPEAFLKIRHQTIKNVTNDYENLKFNTAISHIMVYTNTLLKADKIAKIDLKTILILLNPIAPHLTEEMNSKLNEEPIINQEWPKYDESKLKEDQVEIAVQINNKVRAKVVVNFEAQEAEVLKQIQEEHEHLKVNVGVVKVIYIPGRNINIIKK